MPRDILFDYGNACYGLRMAALPVRDGRILLQCPVGTQEYAFIGGHAAFGETAPETLRREIREELHTDAVIGRLIAVSDVFIDWGRCPDGSPRHCHQTGFYFLAELDDTRLPPGESFHGFDEAGGERFDLEYRWFPLEALRTMTVYPPEVAAHLLSGAKDVLYFSYTELPEDTPWPD